MCTLPRIRLCLEPLEDRFLLSAAPVLQMTGATTTDHQTISVNYNISGASIAGQTLNFNVYRTAGYNSLSGAQLIGTAALPASDSGDLSVGSHQGVKLSLTGTNGQTLTALRPNAALPFIVVVANPGGSIAEGDGSNNTRLVRDARPWRRRPRSGTRPVLVAGRIAAGVGNADGGSLTANGRLRGGHRLRLVAVEHSALPPSTVNRGEPALLAGRREADQLAAQHPGDVVDINFIGHSRGTVVVSQVLQDLSGARAIRPRGGYMQMTLLDPHPANNLYGQFNWVFLNADANSFAELVILFQALTRDPQVVVPPNVAQVQVFDEQTLAGQLFSEPSEFFLNFWGDPPRKSATTPLSRSRSGT